MFKERENNINKTYFIYRFFDYSIVTGPLITALYLSKNLTLVQIAFLGSISGLITVLMELPTGIISDKFGHKYCMLLGTIAFMLSEFVKIFAGGMLGFSLAVVFMSMGAAFSSGAITSYIFAYIKKYDTSKDYVEIDSKIKKWKSVKNVVMMLVVSALTMHSMVTPFIVASILSAIAIPFCLMLPNIKEKSNENLNILGLLKSIGKAVSNKRILVLTLGSSLNIVITRTIFLYQYVVWKDVGIEITNQMFVYTGMCLLQIIVYKYANKFIEFTKGGSITILLLLNLLTVCLLSVANNKIIAILAFVPAIVSGILYEGVFNKYVGYHAQDSVKASVFSFMSLTKNLSYFVFAIVCGYVYTYSGLDGIYTFLLLFGVVSLLILTVLMVKFLGNHDYDIVD